MNLDKYYLQVTYLQTPYLCYLNRITQNAKERFFLYDANQNKVIAKSDNPNDFDKIIEKFYQSIDKKTK